MKKRKAGSGAGVMEILQIPPDLAKKDCILTLCGRGELYIENYRKILEYKEDRIRILTRNGRLSVEGADLAIASYTGEEMYVTGRIRSLAIGGAGREG